MRRSLTAGMICMLGLLATAPSARAMQFEAVQATQTDAIIGGRGPIVKGDTARLQQAFASIPQTLKFLVLELDSPGGSVAEGVELMNYIRANRLPVLIPSNAKCASACFLLFAAAPRRLAAPDALIGVHSASVDGKETGDTLAITTQMARWAGELGVPPAILGKMVQAKPLPQAGEAVQVEDRQRLIRPGLMERAVVGGDRSRQRGALDLREQNHRPRVVCDGLLHGAQGDAGDVLREQQVAFDTAGTDRLLVFIGQPVQESQYLGARRPDIALQFDFDDAAFGDDKTE